MDSKQLLRYLSNASWAVADAVLNRLQDPQAPFVATETSGATRAAAGYLVKAPNGLIVLRTSETDTPLWNPKWLAKLTDQERASVADVLFAAQLSQLRTSLDVLALVDQQLAGTTWTLGKNNLSAKVVDRNGVKIGDVDLNGFTPEKSFGASWELLQQLARGDWSGIDDVSTLSKPAARELYNFSLRDQGSADSLGGLSAETWTAQASKQLDGLFGQGVFQVAPGEGLEPSLISKIGEGARFYQRDWVLSQDSPSQIGTLLDNTRWFGALNAGPPQTIAVDPAHPEHLILGLINAGLWSSSDSGASWTQVSDQDLGATKAPMNFTALSALRSSASADTLMIAFSDSAGGTETLYSLDSGVTWNRSTSVARSVVRDTLQVGDHVILATDSGLQLYDISRGWDDLLAGNWSIGPDARTYTQLKPIPGDPDRLLGLSDLNQLFLIELANRTTSRLSLPITSSRFRIDTADLGRGQFRLYLLASPDDSGFPAETANPGLATLYSLDIDRDFSGSTVTAVSPGIFQATQRSTQWMAWGYSIPDPADATQTVFRSSLWDALGQGTAIQGGNQWFHTNELLVDPVFPDKVYVGATTLGYLLHPSVLVRQPQERGVNLHWDPAGFNSYVQRPNGTGSVLSPGSSGLSRVALDLWAQTGRGSAADRQSLSAFLDAAGSFNNKTHADAQLLYTDGSYIYYGNDGGLNRFLANPDDGAESVLLKGLGASYTWGEFRRDIEGGGFNPTSPIGPFGLEMLPALGFYPANWESLNTDLVTNLYQGGSLNARGNRWITGAQDNGISVGSIDRYTPYLVSNGDGGAGFFGDSDALLAFTNQHSKPTSYRMLDEILLGHASDNASVPIWQLNGPRNWIGTVTGNIVATLFKTHAVLIDNGSEPPSAGADLWAQGLPLFQPISGDQAVISGDQAAIADHFRRALTGGRAQITNLNLRWIGSPGNSAAPAFTAMLASTATTQRDIADFLASNGGNLYLEIMRENGEIDYVSMDVATVDSSPRLTIDVKEYVQPAVNVSFNGGDTAVQFGPAYSDGASFYFPAEQHPVKRSMIGLADRSRIYVYPNVFDSSNVARADYWRTVDLDQLRRDTLGSSGSSAITSFAFAPWDLSGQTLLIGFASGEALLVRRAFELVDQPVDADAQSIAFNPRGGAVTSLAFSHADSNDFYQSGNGFVAIAHRERTFPEITRFVSGSPVPDAAFLPVAGQNNDVIVVDSHTIYSATGDGVYKLLTHVPGAAWQKIGGTYNDNLPTTRVANLVYDQRDDQLFAFTYGRGVYSLDTKTYLTHPRPGLNLEILQIPPDWQEHQFIHPLDLVELVIGIDDPRILASAFDLDQVGVPVPVLPSSPMDVSLQVDAAVRSSLGDWYNPQTLSFVDQEALLKKLSVFAECQIIANGSVLETFDLDVNLDQLGSKTSLLPVAKLDLTKPYNYAIDYFGQKGASRLGTAALITYGFDAPSLSHPKRLARVPLGSKLISFSDQLAAPDDVLQIDALLDFNEKNNALSLFAHDWLNLDLAPSLTPVAVDRSLAGVPSPVVLPELDWLDGGYGEISASVYVVGEDQTLSPKSLLEIKAQDGVGLWWVPPAAGRYFVEIRGSEAGSLFGYDLIVDALPEPGSSISFLSRLKGFEANAFDPATLTSERVSPLQAALAASGVAAFPLRFKASSLNPDLQDALFGDPLAPMDSPTAIKAGLDRLGRTGDVLLDFGVLPKINKRKALSSAFYEAVDWDQVDYDHLRSKQRKQIQWDRVDFAEASRSPSFTPSVVDWKEVRLAEDPQALYQAIDWEQFDAKAVVGVLDQLEITWLPPEAISLLQEVGVTV